MSNSCCRCECCVGERFVSNMWSRRHALPYSGDCSQTHPNFYSSKTNMLMQFFFLFLAFNFSFSFYCLQHGLGLLFVSLFFCQSEISVFLEHQLETMVVEGVWMFFANHDYFHSLYISPTFQPLGNWDWTYLYFLTNNQKHHGIRTRGVLINRFTKLNYKAD